MINPPEEKVKIELSKRMHIGSEYANQFMKLSPNEGSIGILHSNHDIISFKRSLIVIQTLLVVSWEVDRQILEEPGSHNFSKKKNIKCEREVICSSRVLGNITYFYD